MPGHEEIGTDARTSGNTLPAIREPVGIVPSLTGYTVFIVAVLYALGFVIWNAALGRFGVSLQPAVRVDYIAASLCYLVFVAAVAVPVWVSLHLFQNLIRRKDENETAAFWAAVLLWNFTIGRFSALYFSTPHRELAEVTVSRSTIAFRWELALLALLIVHVLLAVATRWFGLSVWKLGRRASFRFKHSFLYLTFFQFILFLKSRSVDTEFLFETLTIYTTLTYFGSGGVDVFSVIRAKHSQVRFMFVTFCCLAVLVNAQSFGKAQFPLLPKSIGGGMPEEVIIVISSSDSRILAESGIPHTDTTAGPLLILAETESDFLLAAKSQYILGKGPVVLLKRSLIGAAIYPDISGASKPVSNSTPKPSQQGNPIPPAPVAPLRPPSTPAAGADHEMTPADSPGIESPAPSTNRDDGAPQDGSTGGVLSFQLP
ncbi:MAG: hypothetical protein ABJB97_12220 [Acidobacteriota bacterium]